MTAKRSILTILAAAGLALGAACGQGSVTGVDDKIDTPPAPNDTTGFIVPTSPLTP